MSVKLALVLKTQWSAVVTKMLKKLGFLNLTVQSIGLPDASDE